MPLGTKPLGAGDAVSSSELERRALALLRTLDESEDDAHRAPPIERASAIDFHVHVIDPSRNVVSLARLAHRGVARIARALPIAGTSASRAHDAIGRLAENAAALGPRALFTLYPLYRRMPPPARAAFEMSATPSLLLHAASRGFRDMLREDMASADVSHAVVIAVPGIASNEYVLDLCERDARLVPVVTVGANERDVRGTLAAARARGAIGVKLHACLSGCAPDGAYATTLIDAAADEGLLVIVHTGRARTGLYRSPENGDPRAFASHFDRRKDCTFVLAHMNLAEPETALDVARRRPNVFVDTSWQEARDVRRAVAILGAERVLMASDWPFAPIARTRRAIETASVPSSVQELIFRTNAQKLILARRRPVARVEAPRASVGSARG